MKNFYFSHEKRVMLTRIHNFQGSFTFNGGYVSKVKDVESKPAILCPLYHLLNIQKIIMWIKVIKRNNFKVRLRIPCLHYAQLCYVILFISVYTLYAICNIIIKRAYAVAFIQYQNESTKWFYLQNAFINHRGTSQATMNTMSVIN